MAISGDQLLVTAAVFGALAYAEDQIQEVSTLSGAVIPRIDPQEQADMVTVSAEPPVTGMVISSEDGGVYDLRITPRLGSQGDES